MLAYATIGTNEEVIRGQLLVACCSDSVDRERRGFWKPKNRTDSQAVSDGFNSRAESVGRVLKLKADLSVLTNATRFTLAPSTQYRSTLPRVLRYTGVLCQRYACGSIYYCRHDVIRLSSKETFTKRRKILTVEENETLPSPAMKGGSCSCRLWDCCRNTDQSRGPVDSGDVAVPQTSQCGPVDSGDVAVPQVSHVVL